MIQLAIVSHVSLYREGLMRILSQVPDVFVSGQAQSLDGAAELLESVNAEVVLVDLASARCLDALRALSSRFPASRFLALGVEDNGAAVADCAEAGVVGYVDRCGSVDDLLRTIRSVASGELHCSPRVAAALMRRVATLASVRREQSAPVALTRREQEVVALVEQGLTNKEIAHRLSIATATVRNHVHNILEKLGAHTRGEAAAITRRAVSYVEPHC
jgi:DNA-binding NarL/FixJ family response regulator